MKKLAFVLSVALLPAALAAPTTNQRLALIWKAANLKGPESCLKNNCFAYTWIPPETFAKRLGVVFTKRSDGSYVTAYGNIRIDMLDDGSGDSWMITTLIY